ncbi:MAG: hypothetical protein M5U22_18675 [Thermoleophilia bacterium]|nr:hypothetical protein [Thermoleophilia bacterium]
MKSTVACGMSGCRSLVGEMQRDELSQGPDGRYIRSKLADVYRHASDRAEILILAEDREPVIHRVPGKKAGRVHLRLSPSTKGRPRSYHSNDSE